MISILKGAFDLALKKRDCSIEMKLVPYGGGSMKHFCDAYAKVSN